MPFPNYMSIRVPTHMKNTQAHKTGVDKKPVFLMKAGLRERDQHHKGLGLVYPLFSLSYHRP